MISKVVLLTLQIITTTTENRHRLPIKKNGHSEENGLMTGGQVSMECVDTDGNLCTTAGQENPQESIFGPKGEHLAKIPLLLQPTSV